MRVYKGRNIVPYKKGNVPKELVPKDKKIYTCSDCKYESNRRFNVERHQQRIHFNKKLHVCCGTQFYNKGEYYVHCESTHPETRLHTITSRTKYKIINQSIDPSSQITNSCELHFEQQFLQKTCIKDQILKRQLKTTMCVEYLFSYSDLDIENVPLIKFFTDKKLKSFMNTCSKLPVLNETNLRKQEVNIEVLSEEKVERNLKDQNNRTETKFAALPTKKLILHRFRSNVVQKYEVPLREQNNNCNRQVNFAEKQTEENTPLVLQTRAKKYKRFNRVNKENVPKFSLHLEELNIKLDKDITVPVVTQLHRDFLGAIDFDMYRIF